MPHFGWLNEVHSCVKKLLACFHCGMLWLNSPILVTVDLIARITGLPTPGKIQRSISAGGILTRSFPSRWRSYLAYSWMVMPIILTASIHKRCALWHEFWRARLFGEIDRSNVTWVSSHAPRSVLKAYRWIGICSCLINCSNILLLLRPGDHFHIVGS